MEQIPHYSHDLGKGLKLEAYSIDPNIDRTKLEKIVLDLESKEKPDLLALSKRMARTTIISDLDSLRLIVDSGNYSVPQPLANYREAIGKKWDAEGKFNGPVLVATGTISNPLAVIQGGYYDYAATRLDAKPCELLPDEYPQGKTVEDILKEHNLDIESRARYFGFAHIMFPSKGEEFLLVQRAKGMGIAADCMASPGSTPDVILENLDVDDPQFGLSQYWSYHLAEEMKDEFKLKWGEFNVRGIDMYDNKRLAPLGAVNMTAKLSTKEIAERAYGDKNVLKEHLIFYSMKPEAIPIVLQKFPIFGSIAAVMNDTAKDIELNDITK